MGVPSVLRLFMARLLRSCWVRSAEQKLGGKAEAMPHCMRIVIIGLLASFAFAQSADEFDGWMRTIDEKNQSVQRNIADKDAKAAAEDAQVLGDTFRLVEKFWTQRGNAAD